MRHANPRIYISGATNELILGLDRAQCGTLAGSSLNVELAVKRRQRGKGWQEHTWTAFVVDSVGQAHFDIPVDFLAEAPKGFYDARMMIGGCEICQIEIVKAPSIYVKCAETVDIQCGETQWVEPIACDAEPQECGCNCKGKPEVECSCVHPPGGSCVGCRNTFVTQTADINADYSGIRL